MPQKHYRRCLGLFIACLISIPFAESICVGQSVPNISAEKRDGLLVYAYSNVTVQATTFRMILTVKAEEATAEKAMQRLFKHVETVQKSLESMGATKDSIEISDVQTGQTAMSAALMNMMQNSGYGNLQFAPQPVQAFQQGVAFQAIPAVQVGNAAGPNDAQAEPFVVPKIFYASTFVSADWNIEKKSNAAISMLKFKLLSEAAAKKLDGSDQTFSLTSEQEDEIFERTKIDVRNPSVVASLTGAANSWANSLEQDSRFVYIGKIEESEYNKSLKQAFELAAGYSKQIAAAGNLKLGKMESVAIDVKPPNRSTTTTNTWAPYPVASYPSHINSAYSWEPILKPNEIRLENLGQLQQNIDLYVRYKIE